MRQKIFSTLPYTIALAFALLWGYSHFATAQNSDDDRRELSGYGGAAVHVERVSYSDGTCYVAYKYTSSSSPAIFCVR